MPRYLIYGQAGKALGATYYQLGQELKAVQASFRRENLGMDRLTWTTRTVDLAAAEAPLPEKGQIVELHYDSGSGPYTRLFRGWVNQVRHRSYGTSVVVEGPWSWLLTDATSDQTLGAAASRPTMIFPQGTVGTHLSTVINRAMAEGAPLALGALASTYSITKLQLSEMTYADIVAELLRWVPDAVAWWDYQVNPTGAPVFRLSRRSSMSTLTLLAAEAGGEVEDHDVTARPDQVPTLVRLKYVQRSALGLPSYAEQTAGTFVAGRMQSILISGPEGDTFLPKDDYQSYQIQTYPANSVTSSLEIRILPMIRDVLNSRLQFGGRPNATDVVLANGETITTRNAQNTVTYTETTPTLKFIDVGTGLEVSRIGKHFVITPEPPEWAGDLLAGATKIRITGRIYKLVENALYTSSLVYRDAPDPDSWVTPFAWTTGFQLAGYRDSFTILGYPLATVILWGYDFEIETWLTTTDYSLPATVYKQQPFEYQAPPSGLAANLLAAQSFTPFTGTIQLKHAEPPMGAHPAEKVNLEGAQAELETMEALQRSSTIDLLNWTTEIELGGPARFAFNGLSGRVRSTSQTNIQLNP